MSETSFDALARITSDRAYLTLRHAVGNEYGWLSIRLEAASPVGRLMLTPSEFWTIVLLPAVLDRIRKPWDPPRNVLREFDRLRIPLYPLDTGMDKQVFGYEVELALEAYKKRHSMPWSILALRG